MADDAAPSTDAGQADGGTATQTTDTAPQGDAGQASASTGGKGTSGTTKADPATGNDEPTFFDPKSVPDELKPAYKQMQAAFTKSMQKASTERNKAQFYDQFASDPVGNMQKLAQQYGYQLTRAQAQAAVQGQQQDIPQDWQPQSWQEVLTKAEERAAQKIFGQLKPLLSEVQQQKKATIERQLSEIDPAWQQYEGDMIQLLQEVPGLAAHPEKLYRLAVPAEVMESRATQKALQRLEAKAKASATAGGSTTNRKPSALDSTQTFTSVQEAAAWAQRKLEEEGKWPPKR